MQRSRVDKCVSCGVNLVKQGYARFPCPSCGNELGRCEHCRRQSVSYTCPSCGFQGP